MQRYRRRTVKQSQAKIGSSVPPQPHNVANAHYHLAHFYLSKSQIYGKGDSQNKPTPQNESKLSVSNVINKLQESNMPSDWIREKKDLKKRQNVMIPIYVKNSIRSNFTSN